MAAQAVALPEVVGAAVVAEDLAADLVPADSAAVVVARAA
jgi:hypothetical protein